MSSPLRMGEYFEMNVKEREIMSDTTLTPEEQQKKLAKELLKIERSYNTERWEHAPERFIDGDCC